MKDIEGKLLDIREAELLRLEEKEVSDSLGSEPDRMMKSLNCLICALRRKKKRRH